MRKLLGIQVSQVGMKLIATVCMLCYIISETILQQGVLHLDTYNNVTLFEAMAGGSKLMKVATLAILMKLLAGISLSIYAFLLVEGAEKTHSFKRYIIDIFLFAMLSEVPYDYAMSQKYWDFEGQNPMFGLVFGLILISAIRLMQTKKKNIGICIVVTIAAMLWCAILNIEFGAICVALVAVYYLLREKRGLACLLGVIVGIPYVTGVFAAYPIFCYSGRRGGNYNKYIFYLLFPIELVICGLLTGCGASNSQAGYQAVYPTQTESAAIYVEKIDGLSEDFIKGMDVSSILAEEASGVRYYDEDGNEADVFEILADAGVNYARIRVWNDPFDKNGNGYGGGNCNAETAAVLGNRAAKYGMKTCVDFHYSDFWADPSKQMAPKEWAHYTFADKVTAIHDYTVESLNTIIDSGADVGMVQIGNEINNGLAGVKDWQQELEMLASASSAVRTVASERGMDIQIVVHFTQIDDAQGTLKKAADLEKAGVDYDIFGVSYYPYWHGTFENMKDVLSSITSQYGKKTCVMETSYMYTADDTDGSANSISGPDALPEYPVSVQGQANCLRDVMAAASDGGALGVFYWEGCWIAVGSDYDSNSKLWEEYGSGWASSYAAKYDPNDAGAYYGGCSWDNQALFDSTGHMLPSLNVFKYVNYGATGEKLEVLAVNDFEEALQIGTELSLPETVPVIYNDSSVSEELPVNWNEEDVKAVKMDEAATYEVRGCVSMPDGEYPLTATVKVCNVNYVVNPSFEDGNRTMWTIDCAGSQTDYQNKAADAYDGDYALHFWDNAPVDFTAYQKIEGLSPGMYSADAFLQGGDAGALGEDQIIYLFVSVNKDDVEIARYQSDLVNLSGWQKWQNPSVTDIEVPDGASVEIGLSVKCKAKGWGTIDSIELFSVR